MFISQCIAYHDNYTLILSFDHELMYMGHRAILITTCTFHSVESTVYYNFITGCSERKYHLQYLLQH